MRFVCKSSEAQPVSVGMMYRSLLVFCILVTEIQGFTMFSWNIHRGVGADGKMDLERTAAIIRKQQADVVVLQEVDQGTTRSGKQFLAQELGSRLGMQVFFGKAIDFQSGEYGQAILSAHPLRQKRIVRLSEQGEARIAVLAEVQIGTEWVTVGGVHFDASSASRRAEEGKKLLAALATTAGKIYVAGDWNEAPSGEVGRMWEKNGWIYQKKSGVPFTFPQDRPQIEIDFFWTKGAPLAIECRVVDVLGASDHRGVVARWP